MEIEYRVKTIERYIITRCETDGDARSVVERGFYTSPHVAQEVAHALGVAEQARNADSVTVICPEHPSDAALEGKAIRCSLMT